MTDRAQTFADQLNELEAGGDVDRFVTAVFATEVELVRPEAHQQLAGQDGARTFWTQYLAHFDSIRSEFSRVADSDGLGVLEWRSTGRLRTGSDIAYAGVSVLDFDGEGLVRRFATYYDTTPFHADPVSEPQG